jgi:hypothetical protein
MSKPKNAQIHPYTVSEEVVPGFEKLSERDLLGTGLMVFGKEGNVMTGPTR